MSYSCSPDTHLCKCAHIHLPLTLLSFFAISEPSRFLVHRYSVMREHAEANGLEEADHLDAHTMESGKTHYHDDSDQVSPSHFFSVSLFG